MKPPAGSLQVVVAFGAGLLTGLSHFPDPLSVIVACAGGWFVLRHPPHRVAVTVIVLGAVVGAATRNAVPRECRLRLPLGELEYRVHTVDPGTGLGRVTPIRDGCLGTVMARWPATSIVPAGVDAIVRARWLPRAGMLGRGDGTLRITRINSISGAPDWVARSRTAVAVAIREQFADTDAPLVEALIGGWRGRIDADTRDAFAATGLIHLLSISGFHIALVAAWVALFSRLIGFPGRIGDLVGAATAVGYAAWLGWPAPATRAAALVAVLVITRWRQRHVRADALLGASAMVVLALDPWSLVDLGAWLSFAAMAGLLWLGSWSRRAFGSHAIIDTAAASIGATLATAPIAALTIGRVAPIGLVLNFAAIPLAAVVMPALILALVLNGLAPDAATAFAASASVLLDLLRALASVGTTLPGAAVAAIPGPAVALPWLLALSVAIIATHGRTTPREAVRRAAWGAALIVWWPLTDGWLKDQVPSEGLALHFLDVGQGDATAIRTPNGYWVLIDAGPATPTWDAGERVVVPFLTRHHVRRLEVVVLSHPHRDHVGGAAAVAQRMAVGLALDPGEPFAEATYAEWLQELAARNTRWRVPNRDATWQLDGVTFRVVHPPGQWLHRGEDPNEDSLVLEVRYGDFSALLAGDVGFAAESLLIQQVRPVDVLKVGHHGSRGSTGDRFLGVIDPTAAVISVGRNNYGHPSASTLARLDRAEVEVWRTDHEGTITVVTDGRQYTIRGGHTAVTHDAHPAHREAMSCCTSPRSPRLSGSSSIRNVNILTPPVS